VWGMGGGMRLGGVYLATYEQPVINNKL
jgi:hypothetical protein